MGKFPKGGQHNFPVGKTPSKDTGELTWGKKDAKHIRALNDQRGASSCPPKRRWTSSNFLLASGRKVGNIANDVGMLKRLHELDVGGWSWGRAETKMFFIIKQAEEEYKT